MFSRCLRVTWPTESALPIAARPVISGEVFIPISKEDAMFRQHRSASGVSVVRYFEKCRSA